MVRRNSPAATVPTERSGLGRHSSGWDVARRNQVGLDLAAQRVIVRVKGKVVSEGAGSGVLDNPWKVMIWLAKQLSARGETLEAGHVITTGSTATR